MTVFLKLGGSLITDKHTPQAARADVLARLMREIAEARAAQPALQLLVGHGSGSFGHMEARKHGTRQGVRTPAEWRGFADVQAAAARLNRFVVDAARAAGLPVVTLPPSASAVCRAGVIESLAVAPVEAALAHDLVPMVFGDVAVDLAQGGTIVSTEDVFAYLARRLRPDRILLAGLEPGALSRWPDGEVLPVIAPGAALDALGGSHAADVTGGMAGKVREMQRLVMAVPGLSVRIFTGAEPGLLRDTLLGRAAPGTHIGAP